MAGPAVGGNRHIVVALITELRLVGMALHAFVLQAHGILLAVSGSVNAHAIAHHLGSPVVEDLHVPGAHFDLGQNAGLVLHLLNGRGVDLGLRRCRRASHVEPEGQGQYRDKDEQPRNDLVRIIHLHRLHPPPSLREVHREGPWFVHPPPSSPGVAHQFVHPGNTDSGHPVVHQRRQHGAIDGADAGQHVDTVVIVHVLDGVGSREPAAHPHFHEFFVVEPRSTAAAEGLLTDGVGRHVEEVVADVLEDIARFFEKAHAAGGIAGVVVGHPMMVIAARVQLELAVANKVGGELRNVNHFGGLGIVEPGAGDGRDGFFQEIRRPIHGVHVLVDHTPHVAAFPAKDPFDAEAFGFIVHLGVETLHHFVGRERTEVATFRRISAPGIIQTDFMEQHQITHQSVGAGIGEDVARWGDEKDLRTLAVEGRFDANAVDRFDFVHEELNHVFEGMRLNAEMVSSAIAIGHRPGDPVNVTADEIEQFARDHGDFGGVNPVGAKQRTAPAFGTLEEVKKPFFEHIHGQLAGPGDFAEDLSSQGEIVAINRTQQLGTKHRHILGVTGTDEEVALVGAGPATHADIHEKPQRPELLEAFAQAFEDDLLPVVGELPVFVGW